MGWEWYRKLYGGLLYLFSPVSSVDVKAWMFANTTKSSSVWNSSRQLYRLNKTVFTVNWSEHWIPFDPRRHPHPSSINFCTLVMIFSFFCTWKSILTLLDSVLLRWDDASGYQGYAFLLVALRAEESSARTTEPETNDTKLEVYAVLSFLLYFKTSHTSQRCYDLLRLLFILETTNFNAVSVTCVNPHWFNSSVRFNKKNVRFL